MIIIKKKNVLANIFISITLWVKIFANDTKLVTDDPNYSPSPYNMEDKCVKKDTTRIFHIKEWNAAIFQIGFISNPDGSMASKSIHKCKMEIITRRGFRLVAAVEHLKIREKRNQECSNYLLFSSPSQHFIGKLFSKLDIDILNENQSKKLCGTKILKPGVQSKIYDTFSHANSFSTTSNKMNILFHQDDNQRGQDNNSFRIIVTAFKYSADTAACEGKQKCYPREQFCIDKKFNCDGHVNCAFPGSGTDEQLCGSLTDETISVKDEEHLNLTVVIIVALVSVVGSGLLFFLVVTVVCRLKKKLRKMRTLRRQSRPQSSSIEFHPPISETEAMSSSLHRESTLPRYETVILSDEEAMKAIELEDLPPKYDALFPEGPPKHTESSL